MIQVGLSIFGFSPGSGSSVQPPDVGQPPVYYPPVPAIDMTAAAGSLSFPEGNNGSMAAKPGMETYKGLLSQALAGLYFQPSTSKSVHFAIVRYPRDKRYVNAFYGIIGHQGTGGQRFSLRYNAGAATSQPNRFQFYQYGNGGSPVMAYSAPWTEDEALVVAWCDGANNWQVDWYSLKDGTRYPGATVTQATTGFNGSGTVNIGGLGATTAFTANGTIPNLWPDSIAAVGYLSTSPTPLDAATWQSIALGANFKDVLPVLAVKFIREFTGATASLARDPFWTSDLTANTAAVGSVTAGVPGSTLLPGTTFRRQSPAQYLLIDRISGGQVYGLQANQTERAVPFSGISAGFSGAVELRVFEEQTGAVVRDWTAVGTPSGGVWSGSLMLPESVNGWLCVEARAQGTPSLVAHRREPFAVGYKFIIMGQSQTQIGMFSGDAGVPMTLPMTASYADLASIGTRASLGSASRWPVMGRVGMRFSVDGLVSFMNQFRRFKPKTPVMFYDDAVNGTSMRTLLEGVAGVTDRHWDDITDKLALYGNDVTGVLWNWLMNEGAFGGSDVRPLMTAMFLPAGLGQMPHSLITDLAPGWKLGILAGDRESYVIGREGMRRERAAFAHDNGFTLGPIVSDYRIEDMGGPHPVTQNTAPGQAGYGANPIHGSARLGQRMAVTALRMLGLDSSQNPYYANARLSPDGSRILVDAVAVNGGTVYSPAPLALRSWHVREPGDSGYVPTLSKGASAVLNGTVVEITRASGVWPAGTQVMRMDDSEKRANGDGAAEDAIHAGGLYETWAHDPLGFGFPVVGRRDEQGRWWPLFEATL